MRFPRLKRLLAGTLACCLLTGCTLTERIGSGEDSEGSAPVVSDHEAGYFGLAYYMGEKVNPVLSTSHMNRVLTEALYEGLFYLDGKFQPQPMLCESWEGDGTTFTFRIKQGVTFWSGEPLTADDVVYSLRTAKKNQTSPYYARMQDVKSVFADDENTVGVVLKSPNMDFPRLMDIPVFRAGTENDDFSDGTGAYQPNHEEGSWWLSPYAGWHGGAVSTFERIELVNAARVEAISHSFETGDISLIRAERISASPLTFSGSVELHQTPTTKLHYLGFGCTAGPGSIPAVRQAVSAVIARQSLCDTTFQSFADPAVLPVSPQPDTPAASMEVDSAAAAAILTRAGITDTDGDGLLDYDAGGVQPSAGIPDEGAGGLPDENAGGIPGEGAGGVPDPAAGGVRMPLTLSILVNNENTFKVSAAQSIADALTMAGIPATVEAVPFEEYTARLAGGMFEIFYGETRMFPDFDLRALIGTGGAINYGRYTDPVTDQLIADMRAQGTDEARTALYTRFADELPIVPIAFVRDQVVVRSGLLTGFNPSPFWLFHGVAGWRRN